MVFACNLRAIKACLLLILFPLFTTSCTWLQDENRGDQEYIAADLSDFWADYARSVMTQKMLQKPANIVHTTVFMNSSELEVDMYITSDNEVFLAQLAHKSHLNSYFFSDGRLSYSSHKPLTGMEGYTWLVAYADQQSYDAAKINQVGNIEKAELQESPVHASELKTLLKLIEHFEAKERSAKHIRIGRRDTLITGQLANGKLVTFALNALKGEKIALDLESEKSAVYFTLRPANGADMEYKKWEGILPHTGDYLVSVFSTSEAQNAEFTLRFFRR